MTHHPIVPGEIVAGLPEGALFSEVLDDIDKHVDRVKAMVAKENAGPFIPNPEWNKLPVLSAAMFPSKGPPGPPLLATMNGANAEEFLILHNDLNRPLTIMKGYLWAVSILTNRWQLTHQGMAFDYNQQYNDGQHRTVGVYLASLIDKRVCIPFWVFFNQDPKTKEVIDIGQTRTLADKAVMELKQERKLAFDNDKYRDLDIKKLVNVVNSMPMMQGLSDYAGQQKRKQFFKDNIDLVVDVMSVLTKKGRVTVRYNSKWAGPFLEAAYYYGKDTILPIAQRMLDGNFIQYPDGKLDPMNALLNRLQLNQLPSAKKLKQTAISDCTVYFIRKALLEVSVPLNRGAKLIARYKTFTKEEADDFKLHGKESKVLKNLSVAGKNDAVPGKKVRVVQQTFDLEDFEE